MVEACYFASKKSPRTIDEACTLVKRTGRLSMCSWSGQEMRQHAELAIVVVNDEMVSRIAVGRVLWRTECGVALLGIRLVGPVGAGAHDNSCVRRNERAHHAG